MRSGVEWIDEAHRLAGLTGEWDRLAVGDDAPFSRHCWFTTWWDAFGEGRALRVCAVWDGGELVAALPLFLEGGRLRALANEHTPAFRPLARDPAARARLAEAVLAKGEQLEIAALPADEPAVRSFVAAVGAGGARSVIEPDYTSPLTDTTGSFADYRERMKGGWRELERRGRKLRREHDVQEALVETPAELEPVLDEGLELEGAGWKARAGTAMLADRSTAHFYRTMSGAFQAAGELRLSTLRVDGRLAAFDLALLRRGRYFLLKTAYDEALRSLAPGLVLRRSVIERCFELGLEAHEFLGPDMQWKRLFATGDRVHHVWRIYPRRPIDFLGYLYRRDARPRLKRAYLRVRRRA